MFTNSANSEIMAWYRADDLRQPQNDGRETCKAIHILRRKGFLESPHALHISRDFRNARDRRDSGIRDG